MQLRCLICGIQLAAEDADFSRRHGEVKATKCRWCFALEIVEYWESVGNKLQQAWTSKGADPHASCSAADVQPVVGHGGGKGGPPPKKAPPSAPAASSCAAADNPKGADQPATCAAADVQPVGRQAGGKSGPPPPLRPPSAPAPAAVHPAAAGAAVPYMRDNPRGGGMQPPPPGPQYNERWFCRNDAYGGIYCRLCGKEATDAHLRSAKHVQRAARPYAYALWDPPAFEER